MTPMDFSFVNEGPFLKSIGFETVLDIKDIAAPFYHLRDNFYYQAAEAFIARHHREDAGRCSSKSRPCFRTHPMRGGWSPG